MPITPDLLDKFMMRERKLYGGGRVRYKNEEWSSKVLAFYARIFNPGYMSRYITTRYPDTFFPNKNHVSRDVLGALLTETHENVHKFDRHSEGPKFNLKYAFPQILAAPFILAAPAAGGWVGLIGLLVLLVLLHVGLAILAISAGATYERPSKVAYSAGAAVIAIGAAVCVAASIYGGGWTALLWLPVLLFLSPWPIKAFWRRDYELRGYTMSLYCGWLRTGAVDPKRVDHIVAQFTGPNYWYMERDEEYVRKEFDFQIRRFDGAGFLHSWATAHKRGYIDVDKAEPYRMAQSFLEKEGLCRA